MLSRHSSEPMVDQRRFSDPRPGNDCDDVDILICPYIIQQSDILFSTKNITSGDRGRISDLLKILLAYFSFLWKKELHVDRKSVV